MPRYHVTMTVELEVDATDHNYAQGKAMYWMGAINNVNLRMPAGITQLTAWDLEVTDIDDTPPEREDEDKR